MREEPQSRPDWGSFVVGVSLVLFPIIIFAHNGFCRRNCCSGYRIARMILGACRLLALRQSNATRVCPLLDHSGQRWVLARDGLSANDPERTSSRSTAASRAACHVQEMSQIFDDVCSLDTTSLKC